MLGVVNLDKPVGPTSHDMVNLLRRLSGIRRIGHAGTLDPLASGVLPILVGAATRFSADLTGGPKRYDAVIRLGWRSATDDGQGPIVPGGPLPTVEEVGAELEALAAAGRIADVLVPVTDLLSLPRLQLSDDQAARFVHGSAITLQGSQDGRAAVLADQRLLGIGKLKAGILHPEKVVAAEVGD